MTLLIPVAWIALGTMVPLSGTVEDAAGRPVAGATVWLGDTIATHQGPEVLATAETDDRGRFRLDRADDLVGRGRMWSPTLWAFKPGSRVAFVEFKQAIPAADEPVRLVLGPPTSASIRVLQPDGQPARGVSVRPGIFNLKAPRPPFQLLDRLVATTGADGRVPLDGFLPADVSALDVTAVGQLVQCLPLDPDTATLTLRPIGRLKARVVADDSKAIRGWTIIASPRPTEPGYRGPYTTQWARETTGDDGRVEFPPLAEGQVIWTITAPKDSDYRVVKEPAATIRAGGSEEVEIAIRRGIRVEGILREEPGGAPIPGIKIDVAPLGSGSGADRRLSTDVQGRFSTLVLPGKIRFSFSAFEMPKEYFLAPGTPHWADFEVKEGEGRHDFIPPRLRKAAQVRGRVVDEADGKPAAMITVGGSWISAEYGKNANSVHAETDARGEFVLGSIAPRSEVRVWASSSPVANSEPVTVPTAGEGEPITLRLRKRPTMALSGRVLGGGGQPLAGASVRVRIRPPDPAPNSGSDFPFGGAEEVRTGPDGRYRTPDQIPVGNHYRVEIQAPGFEPAASRWIVPPDLAVPDLTLRRSVVTRELAGRVVDSVGRPVAGAEVFQSGDGPRKTRGATDGEGRYRVPGIPDAPAFLFVSREGYRFLGRRVEPAERSVEFALRRLDEPPASPLRPAASPVSRDEERAIARVLIAEARKAPGGDHEVTERGRIPKITALVDPDRVVTMIEDQVLTAEPGVLTALAVGRSEGDPKKALEVLDAIGQPYTASTAALGLFDRLGKTAPPEFRRDLLERAGRGARESEEPSQAASQLARVADRWLDLGDADRGSKLVREAQALAEKPSQRPFPAPRDDLALALALARVDLPAALKLLEGGGQQQHQIDTLRAGIANRIAATDPDGARRIIGLMEERSQRPARRDACLRMARTDLPAARTLAAENHDPIVEALLPAVAAGARAESDPATARTLLLESVVRLGKLGDGPASQPSPALALARLLPLASRIDPDRAPGYFWLALSLRPPLSSQPEPMPVMPQVRQHYLDLADLAVLTARYDRPAAEAVFAPVAARLVGMDDEHWGLGPEGLALFRAAGAFDARVARALLDALPEDPTPPAGRIASASGFRHHSKAEARIALAGILGLPPGLRLHELFSPYGGGDWLFRLNRVGDWPEGFDD